MFLTEFKGSVVLKTAMLGMPGPHNEIGNRRSP